MSKFFETALIENREVARDHVLLTFKLPENTPSPLPGQFFMVGMTFGLDPMLKRPFSLHRINPDGSVSILYRIRGRGTRLLRSLQKGDSIQVIGPLGRGFPLKPDHRPLLVGGGLGVVPLVALAQAFSAMSPRIVIGARTAEELLSVQELLAVDADMRIVTDDGSRGRKGIVTDILEEILGNSVAGPWVMFSCGPRPMLKSIAALSRKHNVKGYMSLEEHMACGVGACMGCVARTSSGYRRVCAEGPVFDVGELEF